MTGCGMKGEYMLLLKCFYPHHKHPGLKLLSYYIFGSVINGVYQLSGFVKIITLLKIYQSTVALIRPQCETE